MAKKSGNSNFHTLLTGASKGLGLRICQDQLELGNHVTAINRSTTDGLAALKERFGKKLNIIKFDLKASQSIEKDLFIDQIGIDTPIHGFINNAAMAYDDIVTNMNYDPLLNMYNINVFSPMLITKYAIRSMLYNKISGSIVHVSSISVHTGYKGLSMYASTKGALEAFSKNTAREWGVRGIRSNCLVAGFMETSMSSTLNDDQKNRIYRRTALKKPTTVESVSKTVSFLVSNEAHSITGQNVFVDSGTI